MVSLVSIIALLQTWYENALAWFNAFRRDVLFPYAAAAGRNMIFVRSDQWLDATVKAPADDIVYTYDAVQHTIMRPGQTDRMVRWPWISVTYGSTDISDFFQALRLPMGHTLAPSQILTLFAHQHGVYPAGELQVILRDGTEETVYAFRHQPLPASPPYMDNAVDYIR